MIEIDQLTKRFGKRLALDNVSFRVPEGAIYGLLGHNGAGKSTTIGLLLGHLEPESGETRIGGIATQQDRAAAVSQVGAIFESPAFYTYLTGWRNLQIFFDYSGIVDETARRETVELVGLTSRINDPVRTYSHGMRQRLALAQALLPNPGLLILDEPTDGLDPEGIHEMRKLVQKLSRERDLTILLSSHLLGEMEIICDQIGIMREGRLLFSGNWREVASENLPQVASVDDPNAAKRVLTENNLATVIHQEAASGQGLSTAVGTVSFHLQDGITSADCAAALTGAGLRLHALGRSTPSLEEFYLRTLQSDSR